MQKEEKKIYVDNVIYNVNIYHERRNSSRISITPNGITIRVPRFLSQKEKEDHIHEFLVWAAKKIRSSPPEKKESKYYNHLDLLRTHSKVYQIHIEIRDSQKNFTKFEGNRIIFKISNKHKFDKRQSHIRKQLQKHLAKKHLPDLIYRVNQLNQEHFGKEVKKISYRYTKSRWGICKVTDKEIEISSKLLLAPKEIQDYVIVHELAHLIEANHSKRFWNVVKSVDPNYKQKKKWLNEHGKNLVI